MKIPISFMGFVSGTIPDNTICNSCGGLISGSQLPKYEGLPGTCHYHTQIFNSGPSKTKALHPNCWADIVLGYREYEAPKEAFLSGAIAFLESGRIEIKSPGW